MTENIVKPHSKYYCSECGSLMIETMIGAETCFVYYGDERSIPAGDAFDRKTGKRQYCYHYKCPNKNWYNHHDSFFEDKLITF